MDRNMRNSEATSENKRVPPSSVHPYACGEHKIIDYGIAKYAVIEIRKGKWRYIAHERIKDKPIDWTKLHKRAESAKIEAQ